MPMKRKIYFEMKSLAEARDIFFHCLDYAALLGDEEIPTMEAQGRVLSEPVFARFSSPNFHAAAMDGIAVWAEDTFGASIERPKRLAIGQEAFWINTGHPLPPRTNAVIMVENLNPLDEENLEIQASAYPWQNVRKLGEDMVATELLLPQGHRITAYDLGALIAGGLFTVPVKKQPRVILIPTGTELLDWSDLRGKSLPPGKVPEFNTLVLSGLVKECGGLPERRGIVTDQPEKIEAALAEAAASDCQMVILNAGSSSGSEDYTFSAVQALGQVLVHGVTIMPGKPTILGIVAGKPVIGNPGYPVSATISFEQFARPVLFQMQGLVPPERKQLAVYPARSFPSKLGQEEFLRVNLGQVGDRVIANPLPRGAGTITSLTRADGIIRIPAQAEGLNQNEAVPADLLRDEQVIARTVVIVTDGYVTVEEEVFDLIRNQLGRANMFAFGIGTAVNRHIIEGMAHVGMGEPFVITKADEAPGQAERFRKMIQTPVLTQVKVGFDGFQAYDVEPLSVPDVLADRPVIVFGKWRGKPSGRITLRGISGDGPYAETLDAGKAKPSAASTALRYLWARHRITILSDYNKLRASTARIDEVTKLGIDYNLLTAYTSFVAIDTEVRSAGERPTTVTQPLPLPQGVSDSAVGGSMKLYAPMAMAPMREAAPSEDKVLRHQRALADERQKGVVLSFEDVTVSRNLSKDATLKSLRERLQQLESCVAPHQGKVVLRVTFGADGAVKAVQVLSGTLSKGAAPQCIMDRLKGIRLPATGDGKEAQATVTLSAS